MDKFEYFFKSLEKRATVGGAINKMLHYTIDNPKKSLGIAAATILAAKFGPDIYYILNEGDKKELQKVQANLLTQIAENTARSSASVVKPYSPKKQTYDNLIYD